MPRSIKKCIILSNISPYITKLCLINIYTSLGLELDGYTFTINPQQFQINGHETITLECIFRPKTVSNIYFAELEATILHFGAPDRSHANFEGISPRPVVYVVPLNITLTATGMRCTLFTVSPHPLTTNHCHVVDN